MSPELLAALKVLLSESPGDWVYEVRERTYSDPDGPPNSWNHPRVIAYSKAIAVIEQAVKEAEMQLGREVLSF